MTDRMELAAHGTDELTAIFERAIPFNRLLGLRCLEIRSGSVRVELPFRPELIGNPEIPALHGGALSATLDTTGGLAVWSQARPADRVSTIDLRIDFLRPGRAEAVIAVARVVRLGSQVGVAELRAFHPGDEDEPIAAGTGVYSVRRDDGGDRRTRWTWQEE
ncbi:MAG TPA: hotdog fold thioesterase [Candidatus Sulfomarinibacteraceae bacterium]|nr:hotdog fold thioesterase [Candidatus Sulfomarinibacteraceae bacterium]